MADIQEIANQLWQLADDATQGSDQWWTLTQAAEALSGPRWALPGLARRNPTPLAKAVFETYARNSGNNPDEHFDRNAAEQWMQQALEQCGVIVWSDAVNRPCIRVYMADATERAP